MDQTRIYLLLAWVTIVLSRPQESEDPRTQCASYYPGKAIPGRVSIQGAKSLWGDRVGFPRLVAGNSDRWRINKGLFANCQCPWCPISEKRCDPPKVI